MPPPVGEATKAAAPEATEAAAAPRARQPSAEACSGNEARPVACRATGLCVWPVL